MSSDQEKLQAVVEKLDSIVSGGDPASRHIAKNAQQILREVLDRPVTDEQEAARVVYRDLGLRVTRARSLGSSDAEPLDATRCNLDGIYGVSDDDCC